jgi:G2/mitotic-specific cyclin 1/2
MAPVRASVVAPSSASSTSSTSTHISVSSNTTTTYVPAPGAVRKPLQERIPVANQQDKITAHQQEKPHVTVKKEPSTSSKSLHNVIRQIEYNTSSRPVVKSEPVPVVKLERSIAKRPADGSLLEVMQKLENENDAQTARDHEREEENKRPKREEFFGWDDLDAEDEGDPLMVSEYVADIFAYMQTLEVMHAFIFHSRALVIT